jgi:hypothetical protein
MKKEKGDKKKITNKEGTKEDSKMIMKEILKRKEEKKETIKSIREKDNRNSYKNKKKCIYPKIISNFLKIATL